MNVMLTQSSLLCSDVFPASMYTRKSQRTSAQVRVRNFPSGDWNAGWRGPHISDDELVKLGSEAELLRVRACICTAWEQGTRVLKDRTALDLDDTRTHLYALPFLVQ
jgi:hypothetical protein